MYKKNIVILVGSTLMTVMGTLIATKVFKKKKTEVTETEREVSEIPDESDILCERYEQLKQYGEQLIERLEDGDDDIRQEIQIDMEFLEDANSEYAFDVIERALLLVDRRLSWRKPPIFPIEVNGCTFTSWEDAINQLGYKNKEVLQRRYNKLKDTHSCEEIFIPKVEKETNTNN